MSFHGRLGGGNMLCISEFCLFCLTAVHFSSSFQFLNGLKAFKFFFGQRLSKKWRCSNVMQHSSLRPRSPTKEQLYEFTVRPLDR